MTNNQLIPCFKSHIARWKDAYEVLGVVFALLISTIALMQSTSALQLQSKEFRLRNRPYVIVATPHLSGPGTDTGRKTYPHTIAFDIKNISEIPATQIKTTAEVYINGTRVWGTVYPSTALTQDDPKTLCVFLTDDLFAAITDTTNRAKIICTTTYSGALGEPANAYQTDIELEYYAEDKSIRPEKITLK